MAQKGTALMALDQGYVADTAELPTSVFATRQLSRLKCEVKLHHAEALLQQLTVCNPRHFSNFTNFHSSLTNPLTMLHFSSVCKVTGMPLCFSGSSFRATRPHKALCYKAAGRGFDTR
jgi:hypothetical protein